MYDFNLHWPTLVSDALNSFSFVSNSQESLFSFDCLVKQLNVDGISPFYLRIIIFGCLPLLLSIFSCVIWIILKGLCANKYKFSLKNNAFVSCYVWTFLLYPQMAKMNFSLFKCFAYEDGSSYLKSDMTVKCWEGNHSTMAFTLGLLFLFLWTFAFPIAIWALMRKSRHELGKEEVMLQYGFFYVGLNDNSYYWEILIVNLRKVLFIFMSAVI